MLKIGDTLPTVVMDSFYEGDLKKIDLADYKGKWLVLLFYPADFTFVCPTELEEAAMRYAEFQELGAEVMSVSTDTAFVHKAWHDNSPAISKIDYPMLADPGGKYCRLFGTYLEEEGLSLRGTFIIDPDQKLTAMDLHSNSIGRSTEEILRKLQAAKFVHDNHGTLVCPASWRPGDKAFKPGVDLVGKI
jgi:peroxiredoxin (alkyl hydroperoxide reductase subunit C)